MGLRLFVSTLVACTVVVGCPTLEKPSLAPAAKLAQPAAAKGAARGVPQLAVQAAPKPAQASVPPVPETPQHEPADSEPEAPHAEQPPLPMLYAILKQTTVFSRPDRNSRRLGFLRQGAAVRRSEKPEGFADCKDGWYRIAPEGYVCVGRTATLDAEHPVVRLTRTRADRARGLPYIYGRARRSAPPLYTRLPTAIQQKQVEPDLDAQRRRTLYWSAWDAAPFSETPSFLSEGQRVPRPFGYPEPGTEFVSGRALPETGFAFVDFYEHEGRRWGLTSDLSLVPLDRVKPVEASKFRGLLLDGEASLPVVFVRARNAHLYRGDPRTTGLTLARPIEYREAFSITGEAVRTGSGRYLETRDGFWLRDQHLVRVDPMKKRPSWAAQDRSWIDVSILKQTLVAYEGDRPKFVTLVSTGIGGLGDPEETYATVQGTFLVHTKHVTATMDSDEVGDEFDLRDVPYVQYFQDGYALHAAYWHDSFGSPRSHGCINLSPADARWLFHWSYPPVPHNWHSALSLKQGSLVYVHP